MPVDLVKRIKKARQSTVKVDRFTFTIRRPTDVELQRLHYNKSQHFDIARDYVCGWEGVKESDIIKSGTTDDVPFDPDVWATWLEDRPDFWVPVSDAVIEAYNAHAKKRDDAAKN